MRSVFKAAVVVGGVMLAGCAAGARRSADTPMTAEQRERLVESFDLVWQTVHDRHFDPKFNGVDWDAVKVEFRPKVEAAATRDEAVTLMEAALERLGQSHFGIIPAEAYEGVAGSEPGDKASSKGPRGEFGVDVRVIQGEVVVVAVDQASPADKAGVRPGWRILAIDGKPMSKIVAAVDLAYAGQAKQRGMTSYALRHAVRGHVGEAKKVKVKDGAGRPRTLTLDIVELSGTPVVFGHLPAFQLEYTGRRLASGVGYLHFSAFFDPPTIMPWFREHMAEFVGAPGLIIDLRGNPGGIGGMSMGMGNMLVSDANKKLGTMTSRDATINFVLTPQVGRYTGPVAVLVDELSMSTSEIMAGGLQAIGRARVFGVRTPGMALPSLMTRLPSGDGFQYATANYVSADGQVLEGHGVVPDESVEPDPEALLEGRDVVLDAAERWILSVGNRSGA
jgi:carboxyl-terminal processing protease